MQITPFSDSVNYNDGALFLRIDRSEDGLVLQFVDANFQIIPSGNIARLDKNGMLLFPDINPNLGIPLDDEGKIKII